MAKRTAVPNELPPLKPETENGAPVLLTSKVIETAWRSILEQTIPPETHPLQVKTYKRFFFAGAKALMDGIFHSDALDDTTDGATIDDIRRLDAMQHEVLAFFAEVAAERQ
jgi:hypothetical protein